MKVLISAPDPWNHPIPYYMASLRIARALARAGHEVFGLDGYDDPYRSSGLPPVPPNKIFQTSWGSALHARRGEYPKELREVVQRFKPDLVYMVGWLDLASELSYVKGKDIPVGLHRADPYFYAPGGAVQYPSKPVIALFNLADFFTCNEGQAWNYLRLHGMEGKVHLLLHAVDPELAPSLEEVQKGPKQFLCSTVGGGEDPYRRIEQLKYFYQWTDQFPDQTFIAGGGLWKAQTFKTDETGNKSLYNSEPYAPDELKRSDTVYSTDDDVKVFSNRIFSVTRMFEHNCETFPEKMSPEVLCHRFIHRLYAKSYYGFTPYGWYLIEGPQSEFNTKTFGTKITEQGGSGAAMIANRIRDLEMYIIDGKTGFILEKPEGTKEAFQYAIDNPEEVRRMGENAYEHIHKNHSWDNRYREVLVPIFRDLGLI